MRKPVREMTPSQLRQFLRFMARRVEDVLPPGPSERGRCLFALVIPDAAGGSCVSNAPPGVVAAMLREAADRLGGEP